jgi:predicted GTPase
MAKGLKVVAVRHPMPYGDLNAQKVQRFAKVEDLAKHKCTIEEMEEYEPHVVRGNVIYAGVDYEAFFALPKMIRTDAMLSSGMVETTISHSINQTSL